MKMETVTHCIKGTKVWTLKGETQNAIYMPRR